MQKQIMNQKNQVLNGTIILDEQYYFPLSKVFNKLKNYFLSEDGQEVWSFYSKPKKLSKYNGDYVKLNGTSYKVSNVFFQVKPLFNIWKDALVKYDDEKVDSSPEEFIKQIDDILNKTTKSLFEDYYTKGYVIGKLDDEHNFVSFYSRKFSDEKIAKEECELLARKNPGVEFVYLEIKGSCKAGVHWS